MTLLPPASSGRPFRTKNRLVWVPLAMLAAGTAVLFERRLAGAFHSPVAWPAGLLAGLVMCALTAAARWSAAGQGRGNPDRRRWFFQATMSGLVAIGAASITLAGTSPGAVVALWLPLAVGESWGWSRCWLARRAGWGGPTLPPGLTHRLTRFRTAGGEERVEGVLRCVFPPGERSASVHVSFCPPFAGPPRVRLHRVSGPGVRIRAAMVLPHGVRFDLRLAGAPILSPQDVVFLFTAAR